DAFAWQVLAFGMACSDIQAHSGVVDRIVVGERCTIPSTVNGRGGVVRVSFLLKPLGPDSLRPVTGIAQPIFSVKTDVLDESTQGADADTKNNFAAFPV